MADIYVKNDDTAPVLNATLVGADLEPVNLEGVQGVRMLMREMRSSLQVVDAAAEVTQIGDGTDGTMGFVRYEWDPTDTATPGGYYAEFEVTFAAGEIETFPNDGYLTVAILDDLEATGS